MRASQQLIDHLKRTEGCRLTAYQDSASVWTIGYGHTRGVKRGDCITQSQSEQFLREDLTEFELYVSTRVRGIRTQGQFDAVVDFCYNIGTSKFQSSTLRAYIEAGRKVYEIQQQFMRWVNAGGKFAGGLYTRRIWEAARWNE